MLKSLGYVPLLSVLFERSEVSEGTSPLYVDYKMARLTPFGIIEVFDKVLFTKFSADGAIVTDGIMMRRLSAAIHVEEGSRLIESSATTGFGDAKVRTSRRA